MKELNPTHLFLVMTQNNSSLRRRVGGFYNGNFIHRIQEIRIHENAHTHTHADVPNYFEFNNCRNSVIPAVDISVGCFTAFSSRRAFPIMSFLRRNDRKLSG